jgi:hypothetical protein
LNFNLAGEDLPPANPARVVQANSAMAWGIVLFDVWIVNGDRHRRNIAFDADTNRLQIFDHGNALFCPDHERLVIMRDQLAIGQHCLANEIVSLDGMLTWLQRINSIPEFYIRSLIESAVDVGLPAEHIDLCASFLIERRANLLTLLHTFHSSFFPKVEKRLWDELAQEVEEPAEVLEADNSKRVDNKISESNSDSSGDNL